MLHLLYFFYVLEFLLNLLYINQLTRALNYSITFDATPISIKNSRISKAVGIGQGMSLMDFTKYMRLYNNPLF